MVAQTQKHKKMKKEDLPSEHLQAPLRVGSEVMVIDGSYTLSIRNKSKKLEHDYLGLSEDIWTVIAINVSCPTYVHSNTIRLRYGNNCIIANENGDVAFVSIVNIRNTKSL